MPYGFSLALGFLTRKFALRALHPARKLTGYLLVSRARKTNARYAVACFPFAQALLGLFADVSKDTAIYIEDVSIDCIGCLRSKEYSGTGQLFGL